LYEIHLFDEVAAVRLLYTAVPKCLVPGPLLKARSVAPLAPAEVPEPFANVAVVDVFDVMVKLPLLPTLPAEKPLMFMFSPTQLFVPASACDANVIVVTPVVVVMAVMTMFAGWDVAHR
jgi:hypothetical protein